MRAHIILILGSTYGTEYNVSRGCSNVNLRFITKLLGNVLYGLDQDLWSLLIGTHEYAAIIGPVLTDSVDTLQSILLPHGTNN